MSCLPNWWADWLCPHGRPQALPAGLRTGAASAATTGWSTGGWFMNCWRLFGSSNERRILWSALAERLARERKQPGALAQLGEHLLCKQRVIGSIPIGSTIIIQDKKLKVCRFARSSLAACSPTIVKKKTDLEGSSPKAT